MPPRVLCCALALVAISACSSVPRVKAAPPSPPSPPSGSCNGCCSESIFLAEVDPASTLDFRPSHCTLHLGGWYANEELLPGPPRAVFFLFCQEHGSSEESLSITYRGPPVGDAPLTDLADPYHTGGRDDVTLVSYAFGGPQAHARYRFDEGEVRFHRPPRSLLDAATATDTDGHGDYVELGVDLRFEGDRRFRAALRICPSHADHRPVSDPVE